MFEENETNYQLKGLESCIKTRPSIFFEYLKTIQEEQAQKVYKEEAIEMKDD